ncbi:MAG: PhzF family phenazine biosynthesis protein [Gammaproteobacteria bacterium]|jgi:PhzF family phenazine biosynthesis protein
MNTLNFHTVDVFTEKPFTGNSLAIVEQADALNDTQMQTLAREFNLPDNLQLVVQFSLLRKYTATLLILKPKLFWRRSLVWSR